MFRRSWHPKMIDGSHSYSRASAYFLTAPFQSKRLFVLGRLFLPVTVGMVFDTFIPQLCHDFLKPSLCRLLPETVRVTIFFVSLKTPMKPSLSQSGEVFFLIRATAGGSNCNSLLVPFLSLYQEPGCWFPFVVLIRGRGTTAPPSLHGTPPS